MNLANVKLPVGSLLSTPKLTSVPDMKIPRIVNAIDNIQNLNRLRDMDNLSYQIKLKDQQKRICEKRLRSIDSTIDIKIGIILSVIIIIFSVIIPFLIVSFEYLLSSFKNIVFKYLIVSFSISMILMVIYLICFWKK